MSTYAIKGLADKYSKLYEWYLRVCFWLKLMMFERAFWLYDKLFGFMRVSFDEGSYVIKQGDSH